LNPWYHVLVIKLNHRACDLPCQEERIAMITTPCHSQVELHLQRFSQQCCDLQALAAGGPVGLQRRGMGAG
jgi:hypothetical protein